MELQMEAQRLHTGKNIKLRIGDCRVHGKQKSSNIATRPTAKISVSSNFYLLMFSAALGPDQWSNSLPKQSGYVAIIANYLQGQFCV